MDCCSAHTRGINRLFGPGLARKEARQYRQKGLPKRLRPVVAFLERQGIEGASILDIGFGVGALHLELLRRRAAHVTGVEVSEAYLAAAQDLADELGFAGAVDYRQGDYVQLQGELAGADVVVLDRTVCCYPDWRALVEPSARQARRLYVLVLPADRWYTRAFTRALNVGCALIRHPYRTYAHPRAEIEATITNTGLVRAASERFRWWEAVIYARGWTA